VVRPTSAVFIAIFSAYILYTYPRQFVRYSLLALPVALLFFGWNHSIYGHILSPYYQPGRVGNSPVFAEALAGNLISPARGLFVFSPFLVLALLSLKEASRRIGPMLCASFVLILLLHWVLISSFPHWWGGHSFGPRFFTDVLPIFFFLFVFLFPGFSNLAGTKRSLVLAALVLTILPAVYIHYKGSNVQRVYGWNALPVNIDEAPERLWDWTDLQFLR
jgi:hypothetical protein